MKKQLLIAAVAATMTSAAMADIAITGDAKFEYKNYDSNIAATYGSASVNASGTANTTNTEMNLKVAGKNGDTSVVANFEINSHGAGSSDTMDIEDVYMTTKVQGIDLKLGNYATGTSAIMGEIDNGQRATNKVTASTTIEGVKVYVGDSGAADATGESQVKGNMFYGVKADVAGFTVEAKHLNPTDDAFAISGELQGLGIRLEQKNSDTTDSDVTFGNLTYSTNGFDLGYAWIDADSDDKITEDDSSIFAVENGLLDTTANAGNGDSNQQFSIATSVAGNAVTFKTGEIGFKASGVKDVEYNQINVSRPLASGATATVTYTQIEAGASTGVASADVDLDIFEADLSVKF